VLLVLVILPNGSRSLIPAAWTDWRDADVNASLGEDDIDDTFSLGKLDDLLQLRKFIDALLSRHVESALHMESSHAAELGVFSRSRAAVEPCSDQPAGHLGATRRGGPDRRARRAGAHHRPHTLGHSGEGGGQ